MLAIIGSHITSTYIATLANVFDLVQRRHSNVWYTFPDNWTSRVDGWLLHIYDVYNDENLEVPVSRSGVMIHTRRQHESC